MKYLRPFFSEFILVLVYKGAIRSKMAEFVPLLCYFHSAYALYASFKCLAGTQISSFLTLRPQPSEIRLFSRQTMAAY